MKIKTVVPAAFTASIGDMMIGGAVIRRVNTRKILQALKTPVKSGKKGNNKDKMRTSTT